MTSIITDFDSNPRRVYSTFRVCLALVLSIICGFIWHCLIVNFPKRRFELEQILTRWFFAGGIAGLGAGIYTIWSRRRNLKSESIFHGFMNYYVGILCYWYGIIFVGVCIDLFSFRDVSKINFEEYLTMVFFLMYFGTVFYSPFLIPLTFVTRWVVWSVHGTGTTLERS